MNGKKKATSGSRLAVTKFLSGRCPSAIDFSSLPLCFFPLSKPMFTPLRAAIAPLRPSFRSIITPPAPSKLAGSVRDMSAEASSSRARSPTRVPGPVETAIQQKLIEAYEPELIRISNDSSKHAHHAPMRAVGGGTGETHFAVAIVSEAFKGKTPIARHRMVNSLLKEEFDQGLHALSLRLKTPEEWDKETAARVP